MTYKKGNLQICSKEIDWDQLPWNQRNSFSRTMHDVQWNISKNLIFKLLNIDRVAFEIKICKSAFFQAESSISFYFFLN